MNKHTVEKPPDNQARPGELLPPDIIQLLGPPALVGSELPKRFYALMSRFVVQFDPGEINEWFVLWDLVNVYWEIARYRRVKAAFVRLELPNVASQLLREAGGGKSLGYQSFIPRIHQHRPLTIDERVLAAIGLTLGDVADITIVRSFKIVSEIDNIIDRLETRRDKLLTELRTHKAFSVNPAVKNFSSFIQKEHTSDLPAAKCRFDLPTQPNMV